MTSTYIKPASEEMFRLGKKDLQALAAGRPSQRQKEAAAELARRRANRAARSAS